MNRTKAFLKLSSTPITIMLVPHSRVKPLSFRVPFGGVVLSILLFCVGVGYILTVSVQTVEYFRMRDRLSHVTSSFVELQSTIYSLKQAENDFRKLFALKSKKEVLEKADFTNAGSLEMEVVKSQVREAMESVTDIRKYIAAQKDIYLATPTGWPVPGAVSSGYGYREHPISGERHFHSGVDITVPQGTGVKATADGIVSYSGWTPGSGNTVVIEHGYGFSTAYAHNKQNLVRVGQRVRRGVPIAISGSTGTVTGPHVHYEIWKDGHPINPTTHLTRG